MFCKKMKKCITQIYEIQTPAEAMSVIAAGVDHVGSVVVSSENWKDPYIKETIRQVAQTTAKSSLILLYSQPDIVCASLLYYQPDIVHFCENLMDGCIPGSIDEHQCHEFFKIPVFGPGQVF
jgi:phosphoribosylanthranilate isomerase